MKQINEFLGTAVYELDELKKQLSRYTNNQIVNVTDMHTILQVLSSDKSAANYCFKVFDLSGSVEHQAYLLLSDYKKGKWSFDHFIIFVILCNCVRIEPKLYINNFPFALLLDLLMNRNKVSHEGYFGH